MKGFPAGGGDTGLPRDIWVQSPSLTKAQCLNFNLFKTELQEMKLPKPICEDNSISGLLEAAATGPAQP